MLKLVCQLNSSRTAHAPYFDGEPCTHFTFAEVPKSAADFIKREAPFLKLKLTQLKSKSEKQELTDKFIKTIGQMYLSVDEAKKYDPEIRQTLDAELKALDQTVQWETKIQKPTQDQVYVRDLYQNSVINSKLTWGDPYLADSWVSQLDIESCCGEHTSRCIHDYYHKYGVIKLRNPVKTERPKLVIACGNRVRTEPSDNYHPNPHTGDDTIDPVLRRNPTIVGFFGETQHSCDYCQERTNALPDHHYQTVFDEGIVTLSFVQWKEIERVLRPGGFFIGFSYINTLLPKDSKLRLQTVIGIKSEFSCPGDHQIIHSQVEIDPKTYIGHSVFHRKLKLARPALLVFAKPYEDGSYPREITQNDMPSGMIIEKQEEAKIDPQNYLESQ